LPRPTALSCRRLRCLAAAISLRPGDRPGYAGRCEPLDHGTDRRDEVAEVVPVRWITVFATILIALLGLSGCTLSDRGKDREWQEQYEQWKAAHPDADRENVRTHGGII